jgi:LEA14-like dessication related protein
MKIKSLTSLSQVLSLRDFYVKAVSIKTPLIGFSRFKSLIGRGLIGGALTFSILLLGGCAAVQQLAKIQKPGVRLAGSQLQGLSFSGTDLVFDIEIDNPNPLPVHLAGLDYNFKIGEHDFLKGRQDGGLEVAAGSKSKVQIPLSLDFGDLYALFKGLAGQDSAAYSLEGGLSFELPVLGSVRLPLKAVGSLPMPKAPEISVKGLRVKRLKLTGAELDLEIKLGNPNAFGVIFEKLDYRFGIDGDTWAQGQGGEVTRVGPKEEGLLRLPIVLDFTRMGLTAYRVLTGNAPLEYELEGQIDLGTSLPLLPSANLPLHLQGQVPLLR